MAHTFDTRSEEHVAPLLDSIEEVLAALPEAGVEAFPAYGTLLGAVREQDFIGHDSDADLGYVSGHKHPLDVVRESFRLQRGCASGATGSPATAASRSRSTWSRATAPCAGSTSSAASSRRLPLPDGRGRHAVPPGVDLPARHLHARGPHAAVAGAAGPAARGDVRPRLEGARPGVPLRDPAADRAPAQRLVPRHPGATATTGSAATAPVRDKLPPLGPSALAQYVVAQEGVPARLVDVGAGAAATRSGSRSRACRRPAFDYVPARRGPCAPGGGGGPRPRRRRLNLLEWRSIFAEGARLAHQPGPRDPDGAAPRRRHRRAGAATLVAVRVDGAARRRSALHGVLGSSRGGHEPRELRAGPALDGRRGAARWSRHGADIVHEETFDAPGEPGRRIGRTVAQWRGDAVQRTRPRRARSRRPGVAAPSTTCAAGRRAGERDRGAAPAEPAAGRDRPTSCRSCWCRCPRATRPGSTRPSRTSPRA